MIKFVDQVNSIITFGFENLPVLISGREGSGASFFSISLVSYLFMAGKKFVFFSGKDYDKDRFMELAQVNNNDYILVNKSLDILNIKNQRMIFVKSGEKELFKEVLERISDGNERIVFIKNVEEVLSSDIFELVKNMQKLILAGDLDRSEICEEICKIGYDSKVLFSGINKLDIIIPQIPRRQAVFIRGKQRSKIIKAVINE